MILAYSYIRFSTAEQAKGDSLRRQIELREKYLAGKNLQLDETLTMRDLGVSAFKGANADEGALGSFLQAIDEGRVSHGSFLLVESLDRLSRASVDVALQLFLRIIGQGITIVTLEDGREYSQSSIKANFTDLIVSIAIMARAHEESQRKSNLISKAWKQKRVEAAKSGKVMSKVVPFWLKAKEDRSGFVVIEEKAKLIHRMFELSLEGIGVSSIAKMMNSEGSLSPTGKAWRGSNIAKFLRNRAVIGEATFSSFMNPESNREATEPIPNYFPSIISESDFYAVRDRYANTNIKTEHGKKSDHRNLFRRKVFCPYCGGTVSIFAMKYKRKDGLQHYTTLHCANRSNGMNCPSARWDYYEFQHLFLGYVKELDISTLIGADRRGGEIKRVQQEIGKERLVSEQLTSKLNNLIALVEDGGMIEGVGKRMMILQDEIRDSGERMSSLERELARLESERRAADANKDDMATLIGLLGDPVHSPKPYLISSDEEVRRRAKLSMMIAGLVERIEMFSVGYKFTESVEYSKAYRFMIITFKSGAQRGLAHDGSTIVLNQENGSRTWSGWNVINGQQVEPTSESVKFDWSEPLKSW